MKEHVAQQGTTRGAKPFVFKSVVITGRSSFDPGYWDAPVEFPKKEIGQRGAVVFEGFVSQRLKSGF
jgi:hypothetical protein